MSSVAPTQAAAISELALTLPLEGVQLIEASAGTGKTHTLAGIFARLIVERRLRVSEILVVTYTIAAADELKKRLRERLNQCVDVATRCSTSVEDDGTPDEKFCRALIGVAIDAGEPPAALLRRLRLAALSLDEAQISTVHAFCQRALADFAWAAGVVPPEGDLLENERELFDAIARNLWRTQSVSADEIAWNALTDVTASADELARLLWELRDKRSVLEPAIANGATLLRDRIALGNAARRSLAAKWESDGAAAFESLVEQLENGEFHGNKLRLKTLREHRDLFAREAAHGAIENMDALSRYTRDALKSKWNSKSKAFQVHAYFAQVTETVVAAEVAQRAYRELGLLLLHDCATAMRERLARSKRESRHYSYDDLIARLHAAVTGPDGETTAATLAKKFPVALVDECQDSDARQFEIFFAIYRGRGLLALIGDPKQAIYRFRGGDVHAYLRAREQANAEHKLTRNFRSPPALVKAIDRLYAFAGDRAFADAQIAFEPVTAAGAVRDDDLLIDGVAHAPLNFWQVSASSDGGKTNKAAGKEQLAAGCAAEILRLLTLAQDHRALLRKKQDDGTQAHLPLNAQDMAVLVNDHHEATAMQAALRAGGVPSVVISRASVFASDEAADLHAVLRALSDFDEGRLRAVLTTRLLGFSLADLEALIDDAAAWRGQIERFSEWREIWRERGVLALIERVAEHRAAGLLALQDGERRLTNLLHLAELAQHAETGLDGPRALSDWLAQRIAAADQDREEEQLRLESDADRVRIVTLHKSKGLEYPIVFLPFAPLRRQSSNQKPRLYRYRCGQNEIVHLHLGDVGDAEAERIEKAETLAERLRLLYVGLTRARNACYVAWGDIGSQGEMSALEYLLSASVRSLDAAKPVDINARLAELANSAPGLITLGSLPTATDQHLQPTPPPVLAPARQPVRRVRELREAHSFSRLSAGARGEERGGAEDEAVGDHAATEPRSEIPAAMRGTRFGTAFHEIMEKVDFSAWHDWRIPEAPSGQQELIERVLRRHALVGDRASAGILRAAVVRLVAATLNAPLPLGARLADLAPSQYRAELPFHFSIDNADAQDWLQRMQDSGYLQGRAHFAPEVRHLAGLMSGVLDLVVFHQGRFWVIDYKTNLLGAGAGDYAPARLAQAVSAGEYDLQYLIYLIALHRWLKSRLGANYDYTRDVGGALYLFVRGLDAHGVNGIHRDTPPLALIEALDNALAPAASGVGA